MNDAVRSLPGCRPEKVEYTSEDGGQLRQVSLKVRNVQFPSVSSGFSCILTGLPIAPLKQLGRVLAFAPLRFNVRPHGLFSSPRHDEDALVLLQSQVSRQSRV
jgi:hypothetical protein